MYSYIARRLAFGALTVVGVSIMVFVVMRILPGDPLVAIFGPIVIPQSGTPGIPLSGILVERSIGYAVLR